MRRILQLLSAMTRCERWILSMLVVLLILSTGGLLRLFYLRNTLLVPASGGTYIEGTVGELQPLNPWFIVRNDVNRDIVSLVFSGLLRFNPHTKKIEEDLATMAVSEDAKVYTLTLKDNIFWHDSTNGTPHPVTADDVVFTYKSVQDPVFPNSLLRQNFRGVHVEKIDDRTIRFALDEPYSFFPSNLTLGLLPQASFDGIPVGKLDEAVDFGFAPVGAGPYRVKSIVRTDISTEVTLERSERLLAPIYRLDRVVFRIFSDYSSLLLDLGNIEGVRLVPRNDEGQPILPNRFTPLTYTLPQYVSLFFNMDRTELQDQKLRIGLQQGTDKQAIVDAIHESVIVDTPLLEIDTSDWRYKFDPDAAQGALVASRWNLPERYRLQRILEERDANRSGLVHPPRVVLLDETKTLTLSGSMPPMPPNARINDREIGHYLTGTGAWVLGLPLLKGSGAIQPGQNLVKITGGKPVHIIDSFYVFGAKDQDEYKRALEEERIVDLYNQTKAGNGSSKIAIGQLTVDRGMLRMRVPSDPPSIRRNEKGEPLTLHLLTSDAPRTYRDIAEEVKSQWAKLGVSVIVDLPDSLQDFQDRLLRRDYDVLLFGQSLLDNLDSYPYWHSSGIQRLTGSDADLRQDAYNLSQYTSFSADKELETVRRTTDEKERQTALTSLREILKQDAPAIFLFSPKYVFAHHHDIFGVELGSLSLHSDRFLTLYKWYVKRERIFKPGMGWFSLFGWLPSLL
ncbi:hypothetical protein EXS70_03120 [Candidatus Peribacteria bacterium]|nr:hypothetical protein [Candidatus Peribacteria bacterium]